MAAHPAARKRNIAATSGQPDLWHVHRIDTRKQEVLASAARPPALSCGRSPSTGYGCSRSRRTRRSRSATRCRTSASGAPPTAPGPAGLAPAPPHADHPPRGGRWCCGLLSCTMSYSRVACWAVAVPCCTSMGAWHARQSEPLRSKAQLAPCAIARSAAHTRMGLLSAGWTAIGRTPLFNSSEAQRKHSAELSRLKALPAHHATRSRERTRAHGLSRVIARALSLHAAARNALRRMRLRRAAWPFRLSLPSSLTVAYGRAERSQSRDRPHY
jgi:hypothetical protein